MLFHFVVIYLLLFFDIDSIERQQVFLVDKGSSIVVIELNFIEVSLW